MKRYATVCGLVLRPHQLTSIPIAMTTPDIRTAAQERVGAAAAADRTAGAHSLRALVTISVAAFLQGGCREMPQTGPPAVVVRDSAGIEIVESDVPAWTEDSRWQLTQEPELHIGSGVGGDPDLQFASIVGVHRLSQGVIAVVDAWLPAIMFFDSAGGLIGRVGRHGSGPGEFPPRSISHSFTCGGDTVYVVLVQQIAAYVLPGEYARTLVPATPTTVRACGAGGILGEGRYGDWRTAPGLFTDSLVLLAFNGDGTLRTVIDTLPRQVSDWIRGPEGLGYARAPFSPTLLLAAYDTLLATAYGTDFEVELRESFGGTKRILRFDEPRKIVGREDVDYFLTYVFAERAARGNESERRRLEHTLNAALGQQLPAFGELRFDHDGNLWARAYDHLDAVAFYDYSRLMRGIARPTLTEPRRWHVFSSEGRYLGIVDFPSNFVVHEIGSASVLGVWRDDLDIQYVREYRLRKPAP